MSTALLGLFTRGVSKSMGTRTLWGKARYVRVGWLYREVRTQDWNGNYAKDVAVEYGIMLPGGFRLSMRRVRLHVNDGQPPLNHGMYRDTP